MIRLVDVTIAAVLVLHAMHGGDHAQHTWESDVQVRGIELSHAKPGGSITTRVTVTVDGDGARAVRLEILLPIGVGVLAVPPGCQPSPGPVLSLAARVDCALGDLRSHEFCDISIITTGRPGARRSLRFAAFAFSDTPDPRPGNNFVERGAP